MTEQLWWSLANYQGETTTNGKTVQGDTHSLKSTELNRRKIGNFLNGIFRTYLAMKIKLPLSRN